MQTTKINIQDKLPLTCSRSGICCHGNKVMLNPWELNCLAKEKKITTSEFRNLYTEYRGIRLRFDGKSGWKEKKACSQYIDNFGCSVHLGRPLACRLFPLGRELQAETISYMYQGDTFPCLEGCPEVTNLEYLTVGEYLKGQQTESFESAQNEYLKLTQSLADIAFELLLDTGLAESGDTKTLPQWRKIGKVDLGILADIIGQEWIDALTIPQNLENIEDPILFVSKHNDFLRLKMQTEFGALQSFQELHEASVLCMGIAIYLACSVGANPELLAEHWVEIAKKYGALE